MSYHRFKKQFLIFGVIVGIVFAVSILAILKISDVLRDTATSAIPSAVQTPNLATSDVVSNAASATSAATTATSESALPADWSFWTDSQGRFSFAHPAELSITEFEEASGEMVLAQDKNGKSFQILKRKARLPAKG